MKSNVCEIKIGGIGLKNILVEVEKVTSYNCLEKKQALRLRLLAEELTGMLPELVKNFEGIFWIENEGNKYELYVQLYVDSLSKEKKKALIAVSSNNKNAAAVGFMAKIRDIAQNMLLYSDDPNTYAMPFYYYGEYDIDPYYSYSWTLDNYMSQRENKTNKDEWDQLEKSIVAKLADDVIVGVKGKKVDIIIKKEF